VIAAVGLITLAVVCAGCTNKVFAADLPGHGFSAGLARRIAVTCRTASALKVADKARCHAFAIQTFLVELAASAAMVASADRAVNRTG